MSNQEKYVDKINKLLRKAEDRATPPAERDTCIRMAQELMSKWAIDDAMLAAADAANGKKSDDQIIMDEYVLVGIWRFPLSRLAWNVMRANNIKAVVYKDAGSREVGGKVYKQTEVYKMAGFQSDIERFKLLVTSLQLQCIVAEKEWWEQHQHEYAHLNHSKQHIERRGFMFGFANGVYDQLNKGKQEARKASAETHGSGMELVLVSREKQVDDFYNDYWGGNLRNARDRISRGGYAAQSSGRAAGQRADTGGNRVGRQRELGR